MYNIGICDDGQNVCTFLEELILEYSQERDVKIETNVWYSGEGLRDYLSAGNHIDVLFLDIELLKMTGIEVGAYIRNQLDNLKMQIVYISGKTSYAQQLFKTQPLDFLVKPLNKVDVENVLNLAIKNIKRKNERFEFQIGQDYFFVNMGDIVYFSSQGRKIKIVTEKKECEFYGKLKEIGKDLPKEFIMIHQSYIVNTDYISRYSYDAVELTNGTILTISPGKRKMVREIILKEDKYA